MIPQSIHYCSSTAECQEPSYNLLTVLEKNQYLLNINTNVCALYIHPSKYP